MKKIIPIVFLLFAVNSFAQNSYSKDRILELYYKTSVSDYGLFNSSDIKSITESHYSKGITKDSFGLSPITFLKLKKGKIISINNADGFGYTYSYKNNSEVIEKVVRKSSYGTTEIAYKYNRKGNIIEKETFDKKENKRKKTYFKYDAGSFKEYGIGSDGKEYVINTFIENSEGNIISKVDLGPEGFQNTDTWAYAYNNNSQVTGVSRVRFIFGTKTSSFYTYKYYQNGLIKEITESETSILTIKNHYIYEYEYDKYGNWIVKYVFSTYYAGKGFAEEGYKGIKNTTLRKLSYNNGDITGETNIDKTNVKSYLRNVKKENPVTTKKTPKDGAYLVKMSKNQFVYILDGENKAEHIKYYKIIGNNYYIRDSVSNILYVMKDFKSKPIKKEFYKLFPFAKNDEVIWHKTGDDSFVYNSIDSHKWTKRKLTYAKNNTDVILSIFDVKKWVLLDARNMELNVVNKAIPYQDYLKTHPNKGKKEVAENIPSGNVWEKADNGGFIYYVNGENRTQKMNYTFFGDHCVIYDLTAKKSYLIKDIKTKSTGSFNNTIALEGNVFWLKFKDNGYTLIKNATKNSLKAEYAQNAIDVILLNDKKEKVYVLKKFNNAAQNTLLPVINYADYTEKPSDDYILNQKIKDCNADKKCLASLYDETYDLYYNSSSQDQLAQKMANYIIKVYNVHPHLAFTVLLTNKRNNNIIKPLMEKLPKNIRTSIRSGSQEMLNDYNKYINSKEVRDKVKKYGGGYIKN